MFRNHFSRVPASSFIHLRTPDICYSLIYLLDLVIDGFFSFIHFRVFSHFFLLVVASSNTGSVCDLEYIESNIMP